VFASRIHIFIILLFYCQHCLSQEVVGKTEDTFSVAPTGQACYEIPVPVTPGTGGMVPSLTIAYNSSSKRGLLGYGFDLYGLSAISRAPRSRALDGVAGYVSFTADDRFILDGTRLVLKQSFSSECRLYATEHDSYARIKSIGSLANPDTFKVQAKDGLTYEYLPNTKIADPNSTEPALFWVVTKVTDTNGNYFTVSYTGNSNYNELYPQRIDYTGNESASLSPYASVRFNYQNTTDTAYTYISGKIVRKLKCISSISAFYGETKVRELRMTYGVVNNKQLLSGITEYAQDGTSKRPTTFQWHHAGGLAAVLTSSSDQTQLTKKSIVVGDYNGDGRSDFITTPESGGNSSGGWQVYISQGNAFVASGSGNFWVDGTFIQAVSGDYNGDGRSDLAAMVKSRNGYYVTYIFVSNGTNLACLKCVHTEQRSYSLHTIETSGDGADDLLLCFNGTSECKFYCSQVSTDGIIPLNTHFTRNYNLAWDKIEAVDMNGDGLSDILNITEEELVFIPSGGTGQYSTTQALQYNSKYDLSFGDFNGDGKTDILVTSYNNTTWSVWYIAMSDGLGHLLHHTTSPPFQSGSNKVFIADANGDGYDDVFAVPKTGNGYVQPQLFINDGSGNFIAQATASHTRPLDKWNYYFGDFSGDGKTDFVCTSAWNSADNWPGYKLYTMPDESDGLLKSITDGIGNTTEISYKSMSDPAVHTPGVTSDYPLSSFSSSWPLVWQVKTPDGIGGKKVTTYYYENALIHRNGRGVLGFERTSVTDETTGITTTTDYTVDRNKYAIAPTHTQANLDNVLLSESYTTYNLSTNGNSWTFQPANTIERTYEYNSGTLTSELSTSYTYDSYGNVTQMVTVDGDITTTTVNNYINDVERWNLGRLTNSTVTKHNSTGDTVTRHASFDYDPITGLLTAEHTEPENAALGFTKAYTRDNYGNIIRSSVQPINPVYAARTESTEYDSKGRFITSHSNSLSHTTINIVDEATGVLLRQKDPNQIVTIYSHDAFGRQTSGRTAIDTVSSVTGWAVGHADAPPLARWYVSATATGTPPKIEFFDCLGRSIRTVTENAFGQKIYADIVYNDKGHVVKSSEPYFPGNTIYWNVNSYDDIGRPSIQSDAAGHTTSHTYNGFKTVTTDALGHTVTRTRDSHGNLVKSTDNDGNNVIYEYDITGHCISICGPRTTVTMRYDLLGNRIMLNDPDLDTVRSVYNAYGELVSQTDSKGTTTWEYDKLGRVVKEERPDMTITSVYDLSCKGVLSREYVSLTNYITYGHDHYGRLRKRSQKTDSGTYTTNISYNSQGKPDIISYPQQFAIKHHYSSNGLLLTVADANSGNTIWQMDAQDARGASTQETLGNGLTTQMTYNAATGLLTAVSTPGIQQWYYAYNAVGSLVQRRDNIHSLVENFSYDGLDRLTTVKRNGQLTMRMTYDAAGNITSKSDVGSIFSYRYGTNRLFSVYADNYEPRRWNSIRYNSFQKVTAVVQGTDSLSIDYGPDKSRVKCAITKDGQVTTKYYIGSLFEEEHSGTDITRLFYVYANGRAVAVCKRKDNGQDAGASGILYLHHDHLGSVQAITDEEGHLVQELSYDAWGRRRNPLTWNYYDHVSDADAETPWGFSGHEHLDLFEMVNMDGRMYDPIMGRFLSPDPLMQAPDFTQGLNRYVYCLNNPLSLVDPSGYSWLSKNWKSLLASAVGITAAALSGGIASGVTGAIIAGAIGGASSALAASLLNGANIGQMAKSTFTGAFWGAASGFLNFASADDQFVLKLFKHTFSEGWLEGIQGGNALHGFMMGAVSSTGGHLIDKNASAIGKVGKIAANAVLGGTVSEIGGGKFANGAITAAYSIMFNDILHDATLGKDLAIDKDNSILGKIRNAMQVSALALIADDVSCVGVVDDLIAGGLMLSAFVLDQIVNSPNIKDRMMQIAEHTKGARPSTHDKHSKKRAGSTYNQHQNQKRGSKNRKYEHPKNPNKRK